MFENAKVMPLRDVKIKQFYDSDRDNPLHDFYIPVLSVATSYKRITGSFSSGILAKAARGIAGLISNGGKMQLLAGVEVNERDFNAMKEAIDTPDKFINDLIEKEVGDIAVFLHDDYVEALSWMLANGLLEIRIGVVPPGNLSHMKVGIIQDAEGNQLSFSGSNNETPSGWEHNIEEFKVFRGWVEGEAAYFEGDVNKFSELWEGRGQRIKVFNLPSAIQEGIIKSVKRGGMPRLLRIGQDFKKDNEKLREIEFVPKKLEEIKLHEHQKLAVANWIKNGHKGILEMATGTGKTITALACIDSVNRKLAKRCWIIAAPSSHLVEQWEENISEVGKRGENSSFETFKGLIDDRNIVIAGGSMNNKWRKDLANKILDIKNGQIKDLYICVTHVTLSGADFISLISDIGFPVGVIIDEVHGIGSDKRQEALIDNYTYRLGLSATPTRWMDEEGTEFISQYFNGVVYQFTIADALKTINPITGKSYLTPYVYRPRFVYLTDNETEQYEQFSDQISKLSVIKDRNYDMEQGRQRLIEKRANIIKSAVNKLPELKKILEDIKKEFGEVKKILVYCNSDGKQLGEAQEILTGLNIASQQFTGEEDAKKRKDLGGISERQNIINNFISDRFQALVAMKCLDEGVDIPDARIGIILASTQNPREYIQRRGRILRTAFGKKGAYIYDLMVLPSLNIRGGSTAYWKKELERFEEFAKDSDNNAECTTTIIEIEKLLGIL